MGGDSIEFDTVLDLCGNQQRRIVLATLAAEQRSLTLRDLTNAIVEYNHQTPVTEVSEDMLNQVRLSLYHAHIPKLASAGVLNWDPEREIVKPTEQFDQLQPALSAILEADPDLKRPIRP